MFGRLDEDEDLEKEYLIVSTFVNEDPIVFTVTAAPGNVKSAIISEITQCPGVDFSIYELVEHVQVDDDGRAMFVEDWSRV